MSIKSGKVILVGDAKVGKTTFVQRYLSGEYERKYVPTVGVEVNLLELNDDGTKWVQLWDIAGDDRFSGLRGEYYYNADLVLVFFTKENGIDTWVQEAKEYAPGARIVLVHNKVDKGRSCVRKSTKSLPCILHATISCFGYTEIIKLLNEFAA